MNVGDIVLNKYLAGLAIPATQAEAFSYSLQF